MSKVTSMDGMVYDGRFYTVFTENSNVGKRGKRARSVLWPEGAPDPSEVPHAGEKVEVRGITHEVRHGIPEKSISGLWCLKLTSGALEVISKIHRISDAPTVKIGEKTYDLADAIARCEPLEEVS